MLSQKITSVFKEHFATEPIIIRSPGRINLIGEHTDYNEGFVFPAAINYAIYAAIQKSDNTLCKAIAIDQNETFEFSLSSIQRIENGGWRNYILGVVAEIQNKGLTVEPFNLVFGGDIPIGAGLSSSAALENSLAMGLNQLFDLGMTKKEMMYVSQKAEHHFALVQCGIMDQYASMFGKQNKALFLDCRTIESKEYELRLGNYQLLLINTNVKHSLNESAYNDRRKTCEKVADLLSVSALRDANETDLYKLKNKINEEEYQQALYVIQENERVQKAAHAIEENNLPEVGNLLFASHAGLKNQYKVSCTELDFLVLLAKADTAVLGARMMGGGFGGCTINLIQSDKVATFKEKAQKAYRETFGIDCSFYDVQLSEGVHQTKTL